MPDSAPDSFFLSCFFCFLSFFLSTPHSHQCLVPVQGVLERLLSQAQHAQQALQVLHSLAQSSQVCEMLSDGLAEGCQPDSMTATVHSQDNDKGMADQQQQPQVSGHSAEDPMEIDADEPQPNHRLEVLACACARTACPARPTHPELQSILIIMI